MLFAAMLVGMTTFAESLYQPNCNGNYNPYVNNVVIPSPQPVYYNTNNFNNFNYVDDWRVQNNAQVLGTALGNLIVSVVNHKQVRKNRKRRKCNNNWNRRNCNCSH